MDALKPFWKTLPFWISVCTWIVVMGGQYAGAIPAPYGLVASNFVAVVYTVLRCLKKRQAGIPWKAIVFTSEFSVTALTVLVNQLDAIQDIPSLPPKVLGMVSGSIAGLLFLLHALSGQRAGTVPLPTIDLTASTVVPVVTVPASSDSSNKAVPLIPASEAITKVEKLAPTKE